MTMKNLREKVKKHLMTLGVVVAVCGALMIVIPTCGGEEKAEEPTGYSEEYLEAYGVYVYAYTDAGETFEKADEIARKAADLFVGK